MPRQQNLNTHFRAVGRLTSSSRPEDIDERPGCVREGAVAKSVELGPCQAIASLGRRSACMQPCNELAESHSFLKGDGPELIASHAVRFDRIAAIEQPQQVRDGKTIVCLVALAMRTGGDKDNDLTHGAVNLGGSVLQQQSGNRRCTCRTAGDVAADRRLALNGC